MQREFKVGDHLRIRKWEDMEAEFGINQFGDIPCEAMFTRYMRDLCGMEFHVDRKNNYNKYFDYIHKIFSDWSISGDMLEYADEQDADADADISFPGDPFSMILSEEEVASHG